MSTTLRDFIAQREGEIRDQLKALKAELKELQVAKSALGGQEPAQPKALASAPTIKDMARFVLGEAPEGLTSHEILAAMRQHFGREIDRTSLSPQLSRLKSDGEVALMGEQWFWQPHYEAKMRAFEELFGSNIPQDEEDDEDSVPF